MLRVTPWASAVLLAVAVVSFAPAQQVQAQNGAGDATPVLYAQGCASCHGEMAQGSEALAAPALAGQDRSYLERQLSNFTQRRRGAHTGDKYGAQMTLFAQLLSESDRQDLAAFLSSLPAPRTAITSPGNTARGRELYETCAACHGQSGEGGSGPRLDTLGDWYVYAQLRNYTAGARGYHEQDADGRSMAAIAATINEAQYRDLAVYLSSLSSARGE